MTYTTEEKNLAKNECANHHHQTNCMVTQDNKCKLFLEDNAERCKYFDRLIIPLKKK